MSNVWLLDLNDNPLQEVCPKDQKSLREIITTLNHELPFEFVMLLDLKEQKLISKYSKSLLADRSYKLLSAERLYQDYVLIVKENISNQKKIEELSKQVSFLSEETKEQSQKIERFQEESKNQIFESKEELSKKIQESQESLQKLESENKNFKSENENYIKRIQIQAEQIMKYEKETKELNSKCEQLQINFANADKDRNQLKIDLTNLKNQYDLKLSENQKYEEEIKFNRSRTVELEKTINDQKEKISNQQSELDKRQKTMDRLSDTIAEKDQKIYSYMEGYMKFSERLSTMVSPLQEQNAEQKQINELKKQIQELQQKLFEYQKTCQELAKKNKDYEEEIKQHYDQMNQALENKKKESEEQIKNLITQAQATKLQYEKQEIKLEHQDKLIQKYLKDINELDGKVVSQEQIIIAHENSKNEVGFRSRLQRVVELSDRPYINEINFAIEEIYRQNILQNLPNYQQEEVEYQIYQLQIVVKEKNKTETQQENLNKKEIDVFSNTIYELNDLDFSSKVIAEKTAQILIGQVTKISFSSNDHSYDRIQIFQSSDNDKNFMKNSYFAIRQIQSYQSNEIETQQIAINESIGLLIAQNILDKFNEELKNQKPELKELKFSKPYIFSKKQSFRQFLIEVTDEEIIKEFSQVRNLILIMNDSESNQFYDDWRAIQLDKKKQADFIKKGFLFIFYECVKSCQDNQQRIMNSVKQIGEQLIQQEFQLFTQFLDDIHVPSFPVEKFYSAYQIHKQKEGENFMKYNGGHMNFDNSEVGKFLSAFSCFSIKKSHRQICVSHLQGIGNYLYDPLISSYDGILNKLDQGINEIRTIESKCETAKPEDIGEQYLNLLGIQRNQVQLQQIG